MRRLVLAALWAAAAAAPGLCRAESVHVVIAGSGGDPAYREEFADWASRLRTVLSGAGHDTARVYLLNEDPQGDARPSTLESIREVFSGLAKTLGPDDEVLVYLIGHGSHRAGVSRFNVPGPDLSADDLAALLDALPARRVTVINGTSASAGFVNVLSGPGRIVCTATRDVEQRNATVFMGRLVEALEDGSADLDRDGRVSVLEACTQAARLTAAWYANEGLIPTEHALIDDNGDGLGTRLPVEAVPAGDAAQDGEAARTTFIRDHRYPPHVSPDAIRAYEAALDAVETFKARKAEYDEAHYYARLETLLLEAARAYPHP